MTWRQVLDTFDILDDPSVDGARVAELLSIEGADEVTVTTVVGEQGKTDFVRVTLPGTDGRLAGGPAPTLGIVGRLGGLGARPEKIGFVSDGDGALVAVAVAAKLASMQRRGDALPSDVIVATHICPDAPVIPHDPVPMMGSPVDIATMNAHEVDPAMDAVLSIDTTRGNWICNHRGMAISPTVKEGWILRVSDDLLAIQQRVTGRPPVILPITMQDITPYGNDVYHVNSILQPATACTAPVVGVALTAEIPVAGSATGATNLADAAEAARFCVEVANCIAGGCQFYDHEEFARLVARYGPMTRLQGLDHEE